MHTAGPIALLFAGQGAEHVGMGEPLAAACGSCRALLDLLDPPVRALIAHGPEAELHRTERAQPALLAVAVAEARHLIAAGVRPAASLGHSLGQYAALVVANAVRLDDALRLVTIRGRLMQQAVPVGEGAMAVILRIPRADVDARCREATAGTVTIACRNAADETVISGASAAVQEVVDRCEDDGAVVMLLPASAPFHSPLLRPMLPEFGRALDAVAFRDPELPVICNVTGAPLRDAIDVRRSLYEQIEAPVVFADGLETLRGLGVRTYVACGPGKTNLRLARACDPSAQTLAFADHGPICERVHG